MGGDDTIIALGGDDILDGGAGNDTLNGGDGADIFVYALTGIANGYDSVTGGAGPDSILAAADNVVIGLRSVTGVELISGNGFQNVAIQGIDLAQTFNFSPVTLNGIAAIYANGGNDSITGSNGNDNIFGIFGGEGNDALLGANNGFDSIYGGANADTIEAAASNTILGLAALSGVEFITANSFTGVTIAGSDNFDTLDFFAVTLTGIVSISGNGGNDSITGSAAGDTIYGDGGNDIITGGAGNDLLNGGADNDVFLINGGSEGYDSIDGGDGADTIQATADNVVIRLSYLKNVEAVTASGHANVSILADNGGRVLDFSGATLTGIASIAGGAGNDTITGSAGDDTILGGGGRDILAGGPGADKFAFGAVSVSAVGAADLIGDFSQAQGDRIDLHGIDADITASAAGNQAFTFVTGGAFGGHAGELIVTQSGGQTHVFGDVDGDGNADFQIDLTGSLVLQATDFIM